MGKNQVKILFYTSVPRLFRSTGIGHLYELANKYPVILLSEELDAQTKKLLANKTLFPKLESVIPIRQFTGEEVSILRKHYYFAKLAKNVITRYQPDVLVADDIHPFDLYLMRYATRVGTLKLSFQLGIQPAPMSEYALLPLFRSVYTDTPPSLPLWIRLLLIKAKKRLGHILHYWICPLLVGELPFIGKSSFILWKGDIGMRETDYYIVFSKRDYDLCVQERVSPKKLYILSHPLTHEGTKTFFKKAYGWDYPSFRKSSKKTLTVMLPFEEVGIKKNDHTLITKEEVARQRVKIIARITDILKGWDILIKPHPMMRGVESAQRVFTSISPAIKMVNPQESAEKYIALGDVIIGFAPASTTLFTALILSPEKPIISLDFHHELLGDTYKHFKGIKYIDNEKDFINTLRLIEKGVYKKTLPSHERSNFFHVTEVIEHLTK